MSVALLCGVLLVLRGSRFASPSHVPFASIPVWLLPVQPRAKATKQSLLPPQLPAKERAALSLPPQPLPRPVTEGSPDGAGLAKLSVPVEALAASAPARSPLRLDSQVIRRAISGSEGTVRKMARESGTELDSPRKSPISELGSTVAKSAIPDCLAPREYGSLLSAPIIAVQALRGKCK